MMDQTSAPLILTLMMDEASFARLDGLRREHFPPERNLIPAHLTLFHHLPGRNLEEVVGVVGEACRLHGPITLTATGLLFMGRGVAVAFEAAELVTLRKRLAEAFFRWLTAQDRQKLRPHVTVQNKVEPEVARTPPSAARGAGGRIVVVAVFGRAVGAGGVVPV